MRVLDLTLGGQSNLYRPDQDYLDFIWELLDASPGADEAEMDDRAHDACLSASMYELSGNEFGEVYADALLIDSCVDPALRVRLNAWARSCGLEIHIQACKERKKS